MAVAMNEAQIATGSCKGPPMECTPFTQNTKGSAARYHVCHCLVVNFDADDELRGYHVAVEMRKWIAMEETACKPLDGISDLETLDFLFHNCMRFSPHNPGSMYILSGSAVYEHNLECRYEYAARN